MIGTDEPLCERHKFVYPCRWYINSEKMKLRKAWNMCKAYLTIDMSKAPKEILVLIK